MTEGNRLQAALRIFQQVCDLPVEERSAALFSACGPDAALRAQVEAMLAHDSGATRALRVEALEQAPGRLAEQLQTSNPLCDGDRIPEQIGSYEIVRRIGEGGMGTVYEARQQFPSRTVAIKVLRRSGNWNSLQKRFEHEAFILGRLQHPGIAQIIEAGRQRTAAGEQLYLVMELIRGRDLLKFADSKPLNIRQRLELFIRICEAVQHAHQKSVIHRDLKPANILVIDDESGVHSGGNTALGVCCQPKILDFGIARLIDSDLQVTTVATHVGQLLGTLPYMSPEQVTGDPGEIDTRSDVYSLGVILHELLAGRLPYDLRNRSMLEAARMIREEPPERLSSINRALRGDLDTIVAKALEKEKSRRYPSAADLAADVRAFLDGAPIAAKRDSRWYVVQKSLRRYKLVAGLAASLLVISVLSSFAFAVLYRNAEAARRQAETQTGRAIAAEAVAQRQARRAEGVSHFLQDVLHAADSRALGHDARVVDALAYASSQMDKKFENDPESKIAALYALSQTYGDLGQIAESEAAATEAVRTQRSLTPDGSMQLGDLLNHYATILSLAGRPGEAIATLREAEALYRRYAVDDSEKLAWTLSNLGTLFMQAGKLDEAEPILREALRIREEARSVEPRDQIQLATTLSAVAGVLYLRRNFDEAAGVADRAVRIFSSNFEAAPDPQYPICLNSLGAIELERGNHERAGELFQRSLVVIDQMRGPEHPDTASALLSSAQFERRHGSAEKAEAMYRRALEIRRKLFPAGHPELGQPLTGLGGTLVDLKRAAEGAPFLQDAYEIRTRLAPGALTTGFTATALGQCLLSLGRKSEAEPFLREGYDILKRTRGPAAAATSTGAKQLLQLYEETGQTEKRAALDAEIAAAISDAGDASTSRPAAARSTGK